MKFAIASVVLFVATAFSQTLTINTPANVVECQPILLTWSGGTPPYFLSVLPGNSPSSPALQDLGQQTGTSFTWLVNVAAGTSVGLTLRDSTGAVAQSAPFTINPGTSSACLTSSGSSSASGSSVSASSVSASSVSSVSASSSSAAGAASPTATNPATGTTSSSRSGTATGAAAATSKAAAKANVANMGVAGVVGAAVMAILA